MTLHKGSIKGSGEIGSLIFNFILTYLVGKGHKGRWLVIGMTIAGLSSIFRIMPYVVYEPSDDVKRYTKEFDLIYANTTSGKHVQDTTETVYFQLCNTTLTSICLKSAENECDEYKDNVTRNFAFKIFLIAQIIIEVATLVLKVAGGVYLDDNTRKDVFPFLFSEYFIIKLKRNSHRYLW